MNNKFIQQIKCWFTFLFMICSTFSAWGAYAQTAKVTLQMDNVRMEQVMNEIEKQTSYFFIVNKGVDINRTISINVADKPLDTALQAMVAGTDTEYKIYQQNIYLSAAPDKKTANNGSTKGQRCRARHQRDTRCRGIGGRKGNDHRRKFRT